MRTLNLITLLLTILGGLDVGVAGLFNFDLISFLLGVGTPVARVVEVIVGLSALYQLYPFVRAWNIGEIPAEGLRA